MATVSLQSLRSRRPNCSEFSDADLAVKPPNDRDMRVLYIKHGPVQPTTGFERNADGRSFRTE